MDFIDRLREQPKSTKTAIAFTTSGIITLIIFVIWVSVLNFGMHSEDSNTAAVATASSDVNPISGFWSVISKGWSGLAESINQVKTQVGDVNKMVGGLAATSSPFSQSASVSNSVPVVAPAQQNSPEPNSQKDVFILSGDSSGSN